MNLFRRLILILLLSLLFTSFTISARIPTSTEKKDRSDTPLLYSLERELELTDDEYGFFPLSPNSQDEYYIRPITPIASPQLNLNQKRVIQFVDIEEQTRNYCTSPAESYASSTRSRRSSTITSSSAQYEDELRDLEAAECYEHCEFAPSESPRPNVPLNLIRRYVCFCVPEPCINCIYGCYVFNCCILQSIIQRFTEPRINKAPTNKA